MSYTEFLAKPQSKKITLVEIDVPLNEPWQNYQPGIWYQWLTPGQATELDDDGNLIHWGTDNETYYNIGSVNVQGEIYTEVDDLNECIATEKSWYYNSDTTYIYIHFEDWNPPEFVNIKAPGAVIGITNQIDNTVNNYFEDVWYEPLLISAFNLTKKKDSLFYGIMQYTGGQLVFDNTGGYFDDFAERDLYGQPIRIRLSFEGLPYEESELVYSGRVEDFSNDFKTFRLVVADIRKLFSRKLPVNTLLNKDYPDMDSKLDGTPIPVEFGPVIKSLAYKTASGEWVFSDTEFNDIDSGITVYNPDDTIFSHGGVETDGTFTGADTNNKLTVSSEQTDIENGLDIISDILENYENVTFNENNYDLTEWEAEKLNVTTAGIWLGKGKLKTAVDVIERICTDNQGIFDVLADGKFTFRTFDPDRIPTYEILEEELLDDPKRVYDAEEYASSVKVEYSEDLKEKESELYTNKDYQSDVFARYRRYEEKEFETALTSQDDAKILTERVMEQSSFIYPIITLKTKTQNIGMRIMDNILYTYKRQDGTVIIPRSRWQVLGIVTDLTRYEMTITIKQIETDDTDYTPDPGAAQNYVYSSGAFGTAVYGGN